MSKLTDILDDNIGDMVKLINPNELKRNLEAAINAYIAEVIGEDESVEEGWNVSPTLSVVTTNTNALTRNLLRAEQRKRAGL